MMRMSREEYTEFFEKVEGYYKMVVGNGYAENSYQIYCSGFYESRPDKFTSLLPKIHTHEKMLMIKKALEL